MGRILRTGLPVAGRKPASCHANAGTALVFPLLNTVMPRLRAEAHGRNSFVFVPACKVGERFYARADARITKAVGVNETGRDAPNFFNRISGARAQRPEARV